MKPRSGVRGPGSGVLLALVILGGCHSHRVEVADRVNGRSVEGVTVTAPGVSERGDGTVGFDLPTDDRAVVTVRADGYQPWTANAGSLRNRPHTTVLLDPRWMTDFQIGTPVKVIERKPCPCKQRQTR